MKGIGSGIFSMDVTIGEKKHTLNFEFGTLASAYSERFSKMGIFDMFKEIAEGRGMLALMHYFYGGVIAYQVKRNHPEMPFIDFLPLWDAAETDAILDIYVASTKGPETKNVSAPKKEGQAAGV